jgi:hypothetical protein
MNTLAEIVRGTAFMGLVVITPLAWFIYRFDNSGLRTAGFVCALLPVWYLFNSACHEGAHYVSYRLCGVTVNECRLVPQFWKGDFSNAFIRIGACSQWKIVVGVSAPYIFDLASIILGVLLFRQAHNLPHSVLVIGFLVFLHRPLYDLTTNYVGGVFGRVGDVHYMITTYNSVLTS